MLPFGGLERSYLIYIPTDASSDNSREWPLILNYHGNPSDAEEHATYTLMANTAELRGFIVVFPEGYENSWNAGECCAGAADAGIDDIGFTLAILDDVKSKACIDESRTWAAGWSNGGLFVLSKSSPRAIA